MALSQGSQPGPESGPCPAQIALQVIQGRWTLAVVAALIPGVRRFSELRRSLAGISQKVLTAELRELESVGVVERTVYAEVPPRVEYRLTPLGEEIMPVIESLDAWGSRLP